MLIFIFNIYEVPCKSVCCDTAFLTLNVVISQNFVIISFFVEFYKNINQNLLLQMIPRLVVTGTGCNKGDNLYISA